MRSNILTTATGFLLPLLLLFSVFLLLRGHNEPGGGFVGGLAAASAFSLHAITHGVRPTRAVLRVQPRLLMGIGLWVAILSGLPALLLDLPYLTGQWAGWKIPSIGKLGTPLFFDIGVYLAVLGMVMTIVFELVED